jgi:hypothetical protein
MLEIRDSTDDYLCNFCANKSGRMFEMFSNDKIVVVTVCEKCLVNLLHSIAIKTNAKDNDND